MTACLARFSRISRAATQRVALPHAATSPPSALRMRMKASAKPLTGFSMTISWSQPTPVRRSASARTCADAGRERPRPRVDDDEVVAETVHLGEREPCHAGP